MSYDKYTKMETVTTMGTPKKGFVINTFYINDKEYILSKNELKKLNKKDLITLILGMTETMILYKKSLSSYHDSLRKIKEEINKFEV